MVNKDSNIRSGGPSGNEPNIEVTRLWQLPDDFFSLSSFEAQRSALLSVTCKAPELDQPREACPISFWDDAMAVTFFLVTLGLPLALAILWPVALV